MAKIFTNYDNAEDVSSAAITKTDSKDLKKIKKQLKKQKKRISKLEAQQSVEKSNSVTEEKAVQTSRGGKILAKIGDVFMKSLPSILHTATKVVMTAICKYFLKYSEKPRFA